MVVGSPETIADRLVGYQNAGADGVQVMNAILPESYEEFFDHPVPVLHDRWLMQRGYKPGTLSERHTARGYRGLFSAD